MPPGPPPKPPAIRRRDGNPAKRPIVDEARIGDAIALPDEFPPPESLRDEAAAVWREVVPELVEIGLVRSIDATALESMCDAVATAREAREILDREGYVVEGARGSVVHPAYRVWRDSWALALKVAGEYGLTAVARLRVGAAVLRQKSLAEELKDALGRPDEIEGEATEITEAVAEIKPPAKPKPKRKPNGDRAKKSG